MNMMPCSFLLILLEDKSFCRPISVQSQPSPFQNSSMLSSRIKGLLKILFIAKLSSNVYYGFTVRMNNFYEIAYVRSLLIIKEKLCGYASVICKRIDVCNVQFYVKLLILDFLCVICRRIVI